MQAEKEGTMKRSSRSLHRTLCHSIPLVLAVVFALYSVAEAETVAELEKKAADCRTALAWANYMYNANACDRALAAPVQDEPEVQKRIQMKRAASKEADSLENQMDSLNRQKEIQEVKCDTDKRAGDLFPPSCNEAFNMKTRLFNMRGDYDKALQRQKSAEESYQSEVKLASQLRVDCNVSKKQIADGEKGCRAIEQRLQAARTPPPPPTQPQRQSAYPGTPNTFHVECNPMQVPMDGIVTCTVHGIFVRGSSYTNNIDLTNDPETVWQNGPRVSAKGLKPGQTFVVRATKGGASDGVTIAVTGAKQGTTVKTIKLGFVNYQKIKPFTVTVNGLAKDCSGGSGGASWSNVPAPSQSGTAANCVFEVTVGTCEVTAQAPGYQTQSFRMTCDKDQTSMITMIRSN
jgi:hypothetical protein